MVDTQPEFILADFRAALEDALNPHTAQRYYQAVRGFFAENELARIEDVTPELVLDALTHCPSRNRCTALRLGLLRLKDAAPSVKLPAPDAMAAIQRQKRNRSVRPARDLYLDDTLQKINRLENEKLRYAYRLMLRSGLRVSEVAALAPEDVALTPEGRLQVTVRHGKGDKYARVTCMADPYLEQHLPPYLAKLPVGKCPFYSAKTMKNQALALGLECHDLRRMAAQLYREDVLKERERDTPDTPDMAEADERTRDFLRHERFSTTKRYLYNRKLKVHMPNSEREGDTHREEE